jgi:hypothetical protein
MLGKFFTYSRLGEGSRAREGSSGGYSNKTVADRVENSELAKRVMGRINEKLSELGRGYLNNVLDENRDEMLERELEIIVDSPAKIELKFRRRVSCEGYDFNEIMGEALFKFYSLKNYEEGVILSKQISKQISKKERTKEDLPSFDSKTESEFEWETGPARYGLIVKYNFNLDD